MMDRRLLLAFALSMVVLVVWMWLFTPPPPPPPHAVTPGAQKGQTGPVADGGTSAPSPAGTPSPGGSAPVAIAAGPEAPAAAPDLPAAAVVQAAAEEEIIVETGSQIIRLSNRGARVLSWTLPRYLDENGVPLDLVSPAARALGIWPLQILMDDAGATRVLADALYRVERGEIVPQDGRPSTEIRFAWSDGKGTAVTKTIRFRHDAYLADLEVRVRSGGAPAVPTVVWGAGFGPHTGLEKGQDDMPVAVVNTGGAIERRRRDQLKADEAWQQGGSFAWVGLEDKYFAALFLPPAGSSGQVRFENRRLVEEGRERFHPLAAVRISATGSFLMFVGPKDYDLLRDLGLGLEPLVDFGFFSFIALPLFYALKFLEEYVGNFGWAIIILTVGIRLLFFPFMHRGQVRMRKMQEKMKRIQPKMKAMKERYRKLEKKEMDKGNAGARYQLRQKMNEEMMGLYKEEGVNPLGSMSGCLPLLLQIPILYAFYRILTIAIELRQAPFVLWIRDLSQKDPYYVTPIVMGGTMLIQQMMTSSAIADPAQRRIMYLMPIMFTWMFVNLPSGLVLYWLVNNLLGIVQQYLVNLEADRESTARA